MVPISFTGCSWGYDPIIYSKVVEILSPEIKFDTLTRLASQVVEKVA